MNKILTIIITALIGLASVLRLKNKNTTLKLKQSKERLETEKALNDTYQKIDKHQRRLSDKHNAEIKTERVKQKNGDRDQLSKEW